MSVNGLKLLKGGILLWLTGWIYLAMLAGLVFTVMCVTLLCSSSIGSFTPSCGVIRSTFFSRLTNLYNGWILFWWFFVVVYLFNFLPSVAATRPCLDITQKWCFWAWCSLHGPNAAHQDMPLSGLPSTSKFFHPDVCKTLSLKNMVLGVRSVTFRRQCFFTISFLPYWHLEATENSQDKWLCQYHLFSYVPGHLLCIWTRTSAV